MITKCCKSCGFIFPISEFYNQSAKCKTCILRYQAKRRRSKKTRAAILAYENERNKTPERKAAALKALRQRRAKDPEKYFARTWVGNALRDGRLQRQPCEVCGAAKAQAHHYDYKQYDQVRWLCFKCHREKMHRQKVGL
jgi:ribosomal protein S27AE